MNFLLDTMIKFRTALFDKGRPFAFAHPVYEALENFFFSPDAVTCSAAPHSRDSLCTKRFMTMVIIGLLPVCLFGIYNAGYQSLLAGGQELTFWSIVLAGLWQVVPLYIVSYAVGGFWEVVFAIVRKHPISEGFLVTGFLFPLILPPTMPLWQVAIGISFGVVIGKEVFGGVGMNIFNPALVARVFCFFTYPGKMSGDRVWVQLGDHVVDGFSGATPLAVVSALSGGQSVSAALEAHQYSFTDMFIGLIPGSVGETSTLLCILGGLFLVICGVASYRIMLGGVVGLFVAAAFLNMIATDQLPAIYQLAPHYHLIMGGFAFGIVFMATDPVSCAATNLGKWIYGFLIGAICVFIRTVNPAYPEGMMLAILFMNVFAPLIDYLVVKCHIRKRRIQHEQG